LVLFLCTLVCATVGERFFESNTVAWNVDVSSLKPDGNSLNIINYIVNNNLPADHWPNGNGKFQLDITDFEIVRAATTPAQVNFKEVSYILPDCDTFVTFPLPPGGAIEGQPGYSCSGGDCHLLVYVQSENNMYESYHSNVVGKTLESGCGILWELNGNYTSSLRGDICTSADAAGLSIAALLMTPDEVFAGAINHAIRFTWPNEQLANLSYSRPATHGTFATTCTFPCPIYGMRMRLKSTFDTTKLQVNNQYTQTIVKALQQYGMIMADGGDFFLCGEQSNSFQTHTWDEMSIDSHSLFGILPTDFDIMPIGTIYTFTSRTLNCVRNPTPELIGGGSETTTTGTPISSSPSASSTLNSWTELLP